MLVRIFNLSDNALPQYKTKGSAGMDLRAELSGNITIYAGERMIIPTGIYIALPEGYEAQIRPRSGLVASHGVTVLNSPGTIDSDYRGEIKVILFNSSKDDYMIVPGERIAQMVVAKYERVEWESVDDDEKLEDTERGDGGFGSTGKY